MVENYVALCPLSLQFHSFLNAVYMKSKFLLLHYNTHPAHPLNNWNAFSNFEQQLNIFYLITALIHDGLLLRSHPSIVSIESAV